MATRHDPEAKRKHHYLPAGYLAGFTSSGLRDGSFFVFDLRSGSVRKARPRSEAFQRDLYSVNAPEVRSDAFEDLLETKDGLVPGMIRGIRRARSIPASELDALVDFISLTRARSPWSRAELESWVEEQTGLPMSQAVGDPDNWRWLVEWLEHSSSDPAYRKLVADALVGPVQGGSACGGLSFEDIVTGVERRLTSSADRVQLWHVCVMWAWYPMLAAELRRKARSLCLTDGSEDFVCSDRPVGVKWCGEQGAGRAPKYSDEGSMVAFPLDRGAAVVGIAGTQFSPMVASREVVAEINRCTIDQARRFVLTPSRDFAFLRNGAVSRGEEIFRAVRA